MNNLNIDLSSLPAINTEVREKVLDDSHIDTIKSYIIKNNLEKKTEVYVILTLEAYNSPRSSRAIPLRKFLNDWTIVKKEVTLDNHKGK